MDQRRRIDQTDPLDTRLKERALRMRKEGRGAPLG